VSHPLVEQLERGDEAARCKACAAIAEDPAAALLLGPLARALGDASAAVRRAAGDALARLGRSAREVDGLLLAALRGDDPRSRFEAARTLAALAPPAPRLVPVLVEALGSAEPETAWEAARLLADAGRLHAEVVPIVTGLARAGATPAVRRMAIFCLQKLAPERPESVAALLEASRDPDPVLRRAAVMALPAVAEAEGAVAARLAEAAERDPDPDVRRLAGRARELAREERT
jgi:HEAT repeat protein